MILSAPVANIVRMAKLIAEIIVAGTARSQGSKSIGHDAKTGRRWVREDNPKSRPWRDQVSRAAAEVYAGVALDKALRFDVVEYRVRPAGHYGSGRNAGLVRDSAPAYPTTAPDCDKIARAVCDALTKIVWVDDSRVVDLRVTKEFGPQAGVVLRVYEMDAQHAADLPMAERVRGDREPPPPEQPTLPLMAVA